MSKRFSDSEKWEDPWFRNLLPEYQRFWIYLLDKCDSAGIWKVDFEMAEFCLKQNIDQKEMETFLKGRIVTFCNGEKWFIPKFITFQYGELNENCKPHAFVIRILKTHGIEGYLKGIYTLKDKNKNKDQEKTKDNTAIKPKKVGIHFEGCKCPKCK